MAKKNLTRFSGNSGLHSAGMKPTILLAILFLVVLAGCGGGSSTIPQGGKTPIDPSGNWAMKFSDASNNSFILSALFSQTGSVVTALNVLAAGNPAPFSCVPFSATFANGQVLNVDQFSGDINTQFGNIHFTSTLNAQGSHASGTYTLAGTCWGVSGTGTFIADEVPSVAGTWTGTVTCTSNCPAGNTTGTISASLNQNDQTGVVSGSYTITGLANIGSGTVSTRVGTDILSGQFWQDAFNDNNGNSYVIAGGPGDGTPGLGLDRTFNGQIFGQGVIAPASGPATYTIAMSH
ncbi:MAG: hypothetical protein ACJ71W_00725 [Terriglobales bacterium]